MIEVGGRTFPELTSEAFRQMAEDNKLFAVGRPTPYNGNDNAPSMTVVLGLPAKSLPAKAVAIDPYRAWALYTEPIEQNMTQFEFH